MGGAGFLVRGRGYLRRKVRESRSEAGLWGADRQNGLVFRHTFWRRIMKRILGMILLGALMVVGGVFPERVVWSPDGSRAAVLGEDGLHVCDADGNLGPLLTPKVIAAQWGCRTGSGGVVVDVEVMELKTWKEVQGLLRMKWIRVVNRQREEAKVRADAEWKRHGGSLGI